MFGVMASSLSVKFVIELLQQLCAPLIKEGIVRLLSMVRLVPYRTGSVLGPVDWLPEMARNSRVAFL